MAVKVKKISIGGAFLLCLCLGVASGLLIEPAAVFLRELVAKTLDSELVSALAELEPGLSRAIVGLILIGFGFFLVMAVQLRRMGTVLLSNLYSLMRDRHLLPYKYKPPMKDQFKPIQEKIIYLLEHYVTMLAHETKEKGKYKAAIDSYADPTVAEGLHRGKEMSAMLSERRTVTVLFSDIRGFTEMSERLRPEQVVAVLNDYFMFSTEAVNKNHGKVNKFIGDAVMAVFEDRPQTEKGQSAVANATRAGLAMAERYKKMVPVWQQRIAAEISSGIGIGITHGPAVLGNLGSKERLEYTAIGDTVNLAARLCGLAQGGEVRVSEDSYLEIADWFKCIPQEPVKIKGKTGMFTTYRVLGPSQGS